MRIDCTALDATSKNYNTAVRAVPYVSLTIPPPPLVRKTHNFYTTRNVHLLIGLIHNSRTYCMLTAQLSHGLHAHCSLLTAHLVIPIHWTGGDVLPSIQPIPPSLLPRGPRLKHTLVRFGGCDLPRLHLRIHTFVVDPVAMLVQLVHSEHVCVCHDPSPHAFSPHAFSPHGSTLCGVVLNERDLGTATGGWYVEARAMVSGRC